MSPVDSLLAVGFGIIGALFACVGQAGGAGYVAAMGLAGYAPAAIRATALTLTVLVAGIGVLRFQRDGILRTRDWIAFALLGIPCSLAGGALDLPGNVYRFTVAALLLAASVQMLRSARAGAALDARALPRPPFLPALLAGGAIGFIAGIIGVGGGIFLAPLMLSLGWATARRTAAVSQINNLYTAAAALAGVWAHQHALPPQLPWWAAAAALGGLIGSWLGARHLPATALRYILAAVLAVSGAKMALG